jgi:hypothetical protein
MNQLNFSSMCHESNFRPYQFPCDVKRVEGKGWAIKVGAR